MLHDAYLVGWISILPVAANEQITIGAYTYNARTIRLVTMLINSPLWIIYNIIVGTWVGIIDEVVSEISIGISIARYGWKNPEMNRNKLPFKLSDQPFSRKAKD